MKKTKMLRLVVKAKRRRHSILGVFATVVLLGVYQNCGSSKTATTTSNATTTAGTAEPMLVADSTSFHFQSAVGTAPQVFTITNASSTQALNLNVFSNFNSTGNVFKIHNTCQGIGLSTNSKCTVTVSYVNCTSAAPSGYVEVTYQDPSGTPQFPVTLHVFGVAGSPAACEQAVQSNNYPTE